jgi:hypothetical protein
VGPSPLATSGIAAHDRGDEVIAMTLLRWLAVISLGLAAFWVVHAAINLGIDDPYFKFSAIIFALPPTLIGLLLLLPMRPAQVVAGLLALIPAVLYGVFFLANLQPVPDVRYDLWATLIAEMPYAAMAAFNLVIFWAAVLRHRAIGGIPRTPAAP